MNLRDAKEQVERKHPDLRGVEKAAAVKALRDQDKKPLADDKPVRFWLSAFAAITAAVPLSFLGVHGIVLTVIAVVTGRTVWWLTGRR